MMCSFCNISLNSFEIIINFGINVNSQDKYGYAALHLGRFNTACDKLLLEHKQNIICLFVKYGSNLNILSNMSWSILDSAIKNYPLTKDLEIIIMTLVDFGAKTHTPYRDVDRRVLEFIESYRLNNIKPAIKNEIKI